MSKISKREAALLAELEAWAGSLSPGREQRGTLCTPEIAVELTLRVRRRALADVIEKYRAAALERLNQQSHLVRHCGCGTTRKRPFSKYTRDCTARVVAVVVYETFLRGDQHFLFICGRHREKHGIDGKAVLAVVELSESALTDIRKLDKVEHEKWIAKCREEDARREAVYDARKAAAAPQVKR